MILVYLENTLTIICLFSSGILEAVITEPNETKITPCSAFCSQRERWGGRGDGVNGVGNRKLYFIPMGWVLESCIYPNLHQISPKLVMMMNSMMKNMNVKQEDF